MAQPENFAKCDCQHCGGHIEFPIQGGGRKISCPHCNEPTLLTRIAPVEIGGGRVARKRIYLTLAFFACLVAASVGAYFYVNTRNSEPTTSPRSGPTLQRKRLRFGPASAPEASARPVAWIESQQSEPGQFGQRQFDLRHRHPHQ